MNDEFKKLIVNVIKAHPGPWNQRSGYGDSGGYFDGIVDANRKHVFDGEFGIIPTEVFNLLLNFPEIAHEITIAGDLFKALIQALAMMTDAYDMDINWIDRNETKISIARATLETVAKAISDNGGEDGCEETQDGKEAEAVCDP